MGSPTDTEHGEREGGREEKRKERGGKGMNTPCKMSSFTVIEQQLVK